MASPSASSVQKSFKYEVFLSFRGEDTRKGFVDHLYNALTQKGIITYRDDEEIKKGERISDELIRSIEDSKFYIIVFSKRYASSSWCLDELVKIMECQKTNEHTAFPVFYDVEPTEVRKQIGAVGDAFSKLKDKEAAGRWRDALTEAADLAGWELKNTFDGHEAKLITEIMKKISPFISSVVDGKLVGMETRVKDVVSSLDINIEDHVRMIGIWGMGGAGKTTLARAVFDQISFLFEGSSFVGNVREKSGNPLRGLESLQKQVLSDVLNNPDITVRGVSDLKRRMCGKKVLVVLDDVDDIHQLEALAGEPNWFKAGSRVIITTRERQVLVTHGVPENLILNVDLLLDEEANCLFNMYAFGRLIPNQGYEELASQVVSYAAGLPLTIKVLGSDLCGKNEAEWSDALDRLKTIPLNETLSILEVSYVSLEKDYQEIFLDVACILKGWEKEEAIKALESCEFHARSGLGVLEQKSLITVSCDGRLDMHDHIEEMGKNIVRRSHPNEPHRHSRLWIKEEIEDILVNNKGTEAIKCIKLLLVNPPVVKKGLQNMRELRLLEMNHLCDSGCDCKDIGEDSICLLPNWLRYLSLFDYCFNCLPENQCDSGCDCMDIGEDSICLLPNGLKYLSLCNYRFSCFPKKFQTNNLVGLKINHTGSGQRWKAGKKVLKNLRFIDLRNCGLESLNIGLNMNLERLNLEHCFDLVELHMPVECLKLKSIYLDCMKLKTLNLKGARNLEKLELKYCKDLVELHMPDESLKLKSLYLDWVKLKTLNLEGAQNLEKLELKYCKDLVELHMPTKCLKLECFYLECSKLKKLDLPRTFNLQTLHLDRCEELNELDVPVEFKLESLHLEGHNMRTLYLKRAQNLDKLKVDVCEDLVDLQLPFEGLKFKSLHLLNVKLETLDLTQALNLEKLVIKCCNNLVELHMPNEKFKLKSLSVGKSKLQTLDISWAQNLDTLSLNLCEDLVELNMPIESLELNDISLGYTKLKKLNLKECRNLERLDLMMCEDLVELQLPLEGLKLRSLYLSSVKLKTLDLTQNLNLEKLDLHCEDLVELQLPLKGLKFKSLRIFCSKIKTLDLTQTLNLEKLDLIRCDDLVDLHMPIESLELIDIHLLSKLKKLNIKGCRNLERLDFDECEDLVELHMPVESGCTNLGSLSEIICSLQCLRKLTLEGSIPEVPKELDQLECLEELTLLNTNIEHLPSNVCTLKHLKSLRIESCQFLKRLPEDLGRLECLEELHLKDCRSLLNIPNSICEMTRLKCFHLIRCIRVEKLPREIGRLPCLKDTCIEGTGIMDPPESLFQLKGQMLFHGILVTGT